MAHCKTCIHYQRRDRDMGLCVFLRNHATIKTATFPACVRYTEKDGVTLYAEQCEDEQEAEHGKPRD